MTKSYKIKSILLFALVTILPLLKVYLLGHANSEEQLRYIRFYFVLQFLIPIIDFGCYWAATRNLLEKDIAVANLAHFSLVGIIAAIFCYPIEPVWALLLCLATFIAWYNFRLQIFRVQGKTKQYYAVRLGKVTTDATFVLLCFWLFELSVETLLIIELISVIGVSLILLSKEKILHRIRPFFWGNIFSSDYFYMILKVLRANLIRILIPFFFLGEDIESILFVILFYELLAQYLSVEKLNELLNGKIRVIQSFTLYLVSLPVQYAGIHVLAHLMGWGFSPLEVVCILLGGSGRLFSVYTLKAVKESGFSSLVKLNLFLVLLGAAVISGFYAFASSEHSAQYALLTFYVAEVIVSIILIFRFERLIPTKSG